MTEQTKHSPMGYGDVDARPAGDGGDGQSEGGAYPNPHEHEKGGDAQGGQSEPKYSGPGNPNAPRESDT